MRVDLSIDERVCGNDGRERGGLGQQAPLLWRRISDLQGHRRRRYWRVPVMDGEFVCEASTARTDAIGGGNFLVLSESLSGALRACETAMAAMKQLSGVIMPFPVALPVPVRRSGPSTNG